MTPLLQATLNRFVKSLVSYFVAAVAVLPAISTNSWSDVSTYLHSLSLAATGALIMALEKALTYTEPTTDPNATQTK